MLVTTCKHCGARFRVTPEQLNLRQGQVRCGECEQVFNGFESLERFPGDDTGARLLAMRAGELKSADPLESLEQIDLRAGPAEETGARHGVGAKPEEAAAPAASEPASAPAAEPPAKAPPSPVPLSAFLRPAQPQPEPPVADYVPEPPARPSRAWSFGVVLLALVLAAQLAYAFRARIAQQYPALRPVLESVCASAGCTVPWVNDESALKLEDSELLGCRSQSLGRSRSRRASATCRAPRGNSLPWSSRSPTCQGRRPCAACCGPPWTTSRANRAGAVMAPGGEVLVSVQPGDEPREGDGVRTAALLPLGRLLAQVRHQRRRAAPRRGSSPSPRRITSERLGRSRHRGLRVRVREQVDALGGLIH